MSDKIVGMSLSLSQPWDQSQKKSSLDAHAVLLTNPFLFLSGEDQERRSALLSGTGAGARAFQDGHGREGLAGALV